jgi:hypothetical protein
MKSSKRAGVLLAFALAAAIGAWSLSPFQVHAQTKPPARTQPTAKAQPAAKPQSPLVRPASAAERPPREVTMTGRVVSLHAAMTGQFASPDQAKSTADNLRAGVPAALETPTGLVVLGQGAAGAGRTLMPLAFQDVEVQGKLYEKGGVRYLDITSAKAVEKDDGDDDPDEGDGE